MVCCCGAITSVKTNKINYNEYKQNAYNWLPHQIKEGT